MSNVDSFRESVSLLPKPTFFSEGRGFRLGEVRVGTGGRRAKTVVYLHTYRDRSRVRWGEGVPLRGTGSPFNRPLHKRDQE